MREWNVIVGNVVEEVDILLWKEETGGDRVNGRITPTFIEETAIFIQRFKKVDISL